jgi:beta-aspartyl-peptidase (threonine type)
MQLWMVVACVALTLLVTQVEGAAPEAKVVLVIHGGAGVIPKEKTTPQKQAMYRATLEAALQAGYKELQQEGGTSLKAVEEAIKVLEDSSYFNAGKGAVYNHEGRCELDAAIMEGKGKRAGAVAALTCIRNPISAARAVMEKSPHVFMVGRGAELFATREGLKVVDPSYFGTHERWLQLQEALREEEKSRERGGRPSPPAGVRRFSTVGAVALDRNGDLAAGTSTGGLTNKRPGRVGDSPVIGAGTYADNATCAVSCTGHGEIFIRHCVAHEMAARMKHARQSLHDAARDALAALPSEPGGVGGLIALDAQGHCAMPFNTERMFRGWVTADGQVHVLIYDK